MYTYLCSLWASLALAQESCLRLSPACTSYTFPLLLAEESIVTLMQQVFPTPAHSTDFCIGREGLHMAPSQPVMSGPIYLLMPSIHIVTRDIRISQAFREKAPAGSWASAEARVATISESPCVFGFVHFSSRMDKLHYALLCLRLQGSQTLECSVQRTEACKHFWPPLNKLLL